MRRKRGAIASLFRLRELIKKMASKPLMEGWLYKKSRGSLFRKPKWQLRYFRFNEDKILQYSYDLEGLREGRTFYDMRDCALRIHGEKGHMTLLTDDRDIQLIAEDIKTCEEWYHALAPYSLGRYEYGAPVPRHSSINMPMKKVLSARLSDMSLKKKMAKSNEILKRMSSGEVYNVPIKLKMKLRQKITKKRRESLGASHDEDDDNDEVSS